MSKFEVYEHHGRDVWVRTDLKGKHHDHCLCYDCESFVPGNQFNCPIAEEAYDLSKRHGIALIWECNEFARKTA